jgi:hypothetical protein
MAPVMGDLPGGLLDETPVRGAPHCVQNLAFDR